mmetsp:Transcript_69861/g.225900  ORF Transcript_69861/g.225900 Transcript_69861/m.225900 type:complete len:253 (+) Transcript_69861:1050-1808(+)
MFVAFLRWLAATPTTRPWPPSTGPPELPGLIAASIWMRNKPSWFTSMRETTPRVTDMFSPPTGKPMHVTLSSRRGTSRESSRDSLPFQKAPSTASTARSQGRPTETTRALYLMGGPVVARTKTETARCTTCALVTIHLPRTRKPVPVADCWLCFRQGSAKLQGARFTKSLHTEPVPAETPLVSAASRVLPAAARAAWAARGRFTGFPAERSEAPESLSTIRSTAGKPGAGRPCSPGSRGPGGAQEPLGLLAP